MAAPMSRRAVLAAALAGSAAAAVSVPARGLFTPAAGAPAVIVKPAGERARNIIFMVADGCGHGTLAMGEAYLKHTQGRSMHWRRISALPGSRRGLSYTAAANSIITDSAAGSAAWSTGVKHNNGTLCIDPADGRKLSPILMRAKMAGKRVGVVSTTTITHATPAGFYCNATSRTLEEQIAGQLCERPIDVALGGGSTFFSAADIASARLTHCGSAADLAAAMARFKAGDAGVTRVLGTFSKSHIPMMLERTAARTVSPSPATPAHAEAMAEAAAAPSLLEMTVAALEVLARDADGSDGFVLQIEGGRVDHGAHLNDGAGTLFDLLEFDTVIAHVHEWARGRSDTLVVVTTDHATGGLCPVLYGKAGLGGLTKLAGIKESFERIFLGFDAAAAQKAPGLHAADLLKAAERGLGFELGKDAEATLGRAIAREKGPILQMQRQPTSVLGAMVANVTGIAFNTEDHTPEPVDLFAFGPGAETLGQAFENTEIHGWLCGLAGIPAAV
ncbi:alkaline phosphatase [soil metagenome]